jgi:hypothetical protein
VSSHSFFTDWKPSDETPVGLVKELADCVEMNLKIGLFAFASMCWADSVIWGCYCYCEQEKVGGTPNLPEEGHELRPIVVKVLAELKDRGIRDWEEKKQ